MEGKIVGTVRQIEAGDELSGSIINPHPLLFNILKTPTTHTKRSFISVQHYCRRALKIGLMLKASAASQKDSGKIYLPEYIVFHCFLQHFSMPEQKDKKKKRKKHEALLKGNHNKVLLKHSQQSPFQFPTGDELKGRPLKITLCVSVSLYH